jgi:hypothetical protein
MSTRVGIASILPASLVAGTALLSVATLPSGAEVNEHPSSKDSPFIQEWRQSDAAPVALSGLDKFDDDFRHFKYVSVIDDYKDLSKQEKAMPSVCYNIAFSRLRKHDFVNAEAPLRSAIARGFKGYDGYPTPAQLLQRIEKLKRLCPPLKSDIISGAVRIKVFSREMPWYASVNAELPKFLERAKESFGDSAPPISFYFFDTFADYRAFFLTLFEVEGERKNQEGTGNYNVVVFTAKNEKGEDTGTDLNFKHGCILHEYCHALCNTIYGDNYLDHIPGWLDEGLADELARPYFTKTHFPYYKKYLAESSVKERPPSLEEMSKTMHYGSKDRYPFAHEMTDHMLEERGVTLFRPLLTKARELNGDFAAAIKDVSGKTVDSIYEQTVSGFWK